MISTQQIGLEGEQFITNHVDCPNCGKELMPMPKNYPLFDVQCTGCSFRAQIKTSQSKPKSIVRGAGYDVYEKTMKAGYMAPPLIANFYWKDKDGQEHREVRFYPFIPRANLKPFRLSKTHRQPNYAMFNYVGLDKLPYFKMTARKRRLMFKINESDTSYGRF
jgi:DNA-directed RNA polymerase subunit RPC12/RpoP